ncbi:MAG TPA: type II toxin-antitoxin system HicB family antitoxin [Phycisphaerae bacterium]|nr:type II toxin-antitoxin system HicB family antitoxin [Phycisphaerae bacterium]
MKLYHVLVEQEDQWFIGRVLEREGVTTQGRTLDELLFMVRDAIELMWGEKDVELELFVPASARTTFDRKRKLRRSHSGPSTKRWKHAASAKRGKISVAS